MDEDKGVLEMMKTMKRKNAAISRFLRLAITAALMLCLLFGTAMADQLGIVRGGWLILRATPSRTGIVLASYPTGTAVTVLETKNGWCRVNTRDGRSGYMMAKYLTLHEAATPSDLDIQRRSGDTGTSVWVISSNGRAVNLRAGAGLHFTSLGLFNVGTQGKMLSSGADWSYIRIGSKEGYMMTRYLTELPPEQSRKNDVSGSYVTSRNGRNVNLRTGPGLQFDIIASIPVGTRLTINAVGTNWAYVTIGVTSGYMMREFVHDGSRTGN